MGGLHRFMGWDGAILTDRGGFQVYSLAQSRKITDAGVSFRSHIDGAFLELTPERAVFIQENLGSDIAMCLDECPPRTHPSPHGRGRPPHDPVGARCRDAHRVRIRPCSASFREARLLNGGRNVHRSWWHWTSPGMLWAASAWGNHRNR